MTTVDLRSPIAVPAPPITVANQAQSSRGPNIARVPGALLLLLTIAAAGSSGPVVVASTAERGAPAHSAQGQSEGVRDEAAIRALAARMTDAWNRGDASAFAATFVEDGELISGDGTHKVSRPEIERYTADLLLRGSKANRPTLFRAQVIGVRFIDRDVALLVLDGGFMRKGESNIAPDQHGIQSLLAKRVAGDWRAVLLQRTRVATASRP